MTQHLRASTVSSTVLLAAGVFCKKRNRSITAMCESYNKNNKTDNYHIYTQYLSQTAGKPTVCGPLTPRNILIKKVTQS